MWFNRPALLDLYLNWNKKKFCDLVKFRSLMNESKNKKILFRKKFMLLSDGRPLWAVLEWFDLRNFELSTLFFFSICSWSLKVD